MGIQPWPLGEQCLRAPEAGWWMWTHALSSADGDAVVYVAHANQSRTRWGVAGWVYLRRLADPWWALNSTPGIIRVLSRRAIPGPLGDEVIRHWTTPPRWWAGLQAWDWLSPLGDSGEVRRWGGMGWAGEPPTHHDYIAWMWRIVPAIPQHAELLAACSPETQRWWVWMAELTESRTGEKAR